MPMDDEVQSPLAALGGSPFAGLDMADDTSADDIVKQARSYVPSRKWGALAAGALAPTQSGRFSESLSNALGGYNQAASAEDRLVAQYIPIVEQANQRRKLAALQRYQMQQQMTAGWNSKITGNMATLLGKEDLNPQDVVSTLQGMASRGEVPPQVAANYLKTLPKDPAALRGYIQQQALAATDPFRAVAKPEIIKQEEGTTLHQRDPATGKLSTLNPGSGKPSDLARLLKEMSALPPGSPERANYADMIRKMSTHAPPVSVSINPEKPFVNTFMDGLGKAYNSARDTAVGAIDANTTLDRLDAALNSGKVMTGVGADWQRFMSSVGQTAGFAGPDTKKALEETRIALQSLASLSLAGAKALAGQGAVTDFERKLVEKANSGDINFTEQELRALSKVLRKVNSTAIARYNEASKRLRSLPGMEKVAPLLDLPQDPKVLRFDAQGNLLPDSEK